MLVYRSYLDFPQKLGCSANTIIMCVLFAWCSAGVGRTGCFIALDTMLQHIEEHDFIDVFGLASEMRQHRNHMIQTEVGIIYTHCCM